MPPQPEEPDNCCMSGCVNCVWERYRDEYEDWAAKSTEARKKVESQRQQEREERIATRGVDQPQEDVSMPSHVASSMDDDGGGSEANWTSGPQLSGQKDDLFAGVPVGIREFMRVEKRLKEKQKVRQAS